MKNTHYVFLLFAFALFAFGQDKETITAKGIVTNPITGDPVAGATVRLGEADQTPRRILHEATSGDDGRFTFEKVIPGRYRIVVEKPGFTTPSGYSESNADSQGRHMVVGSPDIPANFIRLSLIRTARIAGRVLDAKGEPLSDVYINVMEKGYDIRGRAQLTFVGAALTDQSGEYERAGLRPGEYVIRVSSIDRSDRPSPIIPTTYYPGVLAADNAVAMKVTEGADVRGVDIRVSPSPAYSISVKLQSASEMSDILFSFKPDVPVITSKADDGAYVLRNVPPGDYDLYVNMLRPNPVRTHRVHVTVVDRDVDLKTVNVDSQVPIEGRITVPAGVSMPRNVTLQDVGDGGFTLFDSVAVTDEGTFRFQSASRGQYYLSVRGAGQYIQSARYNARDVTARLVVDDSAPGTLELAVNGPMSRIEGVVQDSRGDAVGFARVVLVPETGLRANPSLFLTRMADNYGRFSMNEVRPGNYTVVAWRTTQHYQYLNPDFIDVALPRATALELKPGQTGSITVGVVEVAGAR